MGGVKHIGQILGHVHVQLVPSARFDPSVQGEVYSPSVHYTLHTFLWAPLLYYTLLRVTLLYCTFL
jgi:hypothetical protein